MSTGTAALRAEVAALRAEVAAIRALLDDRGRAPRDAQDAHLRNVLAASTEGRAFRVADLVRHARVVDTLQQALIAADLTTPQDVGSWLRDHQGTRGGVTIERLRGREWRVYTCDTYVSG